MSSVFLKSAIYQFSPSVWPVDNQGSTRVSTTSILGTLLPASAQEGVARNQLSWPWPAREVMIFFKVPHSHLLYHSMHILLDIKGNCTISNLCIIKSILSALSFNKVGKFYPLARGPLSQCLPQPVNVAKRPRYGNRPVSWNQNIR